VDPDLALYDFTLHGALRPFVDREALNV